MNFSASPMDYQSSMYYYKSQSQHVSILLNQF